MPYGSQGLLLPTPWLSFLPKTQLAIAQAWYINRAPLMARLPQVPIGNEKFTMVGYKFRPRQSLITANLTNVATSVTVADASIFMMGDVLMLPAGERVEVTADPNLTTNVLTIRRSVGGTTAEAVTAGPTTFVTNIGNSRTGGEKFQSAIAQIPTGVDQWVQTFQHVVQVSGVQQAIQGWPLPADTPTPFAKNKMDALQNLMDDVENAALFGTREGRGDSGNTRPKMGGLFNLLSTNNIKTTGGAAAPSNPSAYKPTDFEKDSLERIRANGGQPSLIMVSNSVRTGLVQWGVPLQRFVAGQTAFGVNIAYYISPFLGEIPIIENMWLPNGSYVVLTADQVRFRVLEELDYKPYARVGDTGAAGEGDWIHRCAIEVNNEAMHAVVQNITGFAQQT